METLIESFDSNLFFCYSPDFGTRPFLCLNFTERLAVEDLYRSGAPIVRYRDFFLSRDFALRNRLRSYAPNDKVQYRDLSLSRDFALRNRLRSYAPNDKGEKRYKFKREYYQTAKFVQMLSESDDSVSFQEHARPIEYQTSHGDRVQIHCQQADPDGEPLNSTSPNRMGNAPAKFTAINSSQPSQTVNAAEELSDTESGASPFLAVSQTPADGGDVKKETPSENDNNYGVNKTPPDDDDAKKETASKNDNNNGVNKPPPDDDDAKKETPIKVNKTPPNDDHKGKYKLENALILGGQIISTAAAVSAKNAKSEVSNEAELLLYVVAACLSVSLISIFCGFCLSALQLGKAARFVRKVGMVVTGFALVVATGLQFPDELMMWFIVGVLAVSAPAIIGFAWKY